MSNSNKYKLTIRSKEGNEWVKTSIIDGDNRLVSKQMGSFELDLPKGLYTLKAEIDGNTKSQVIMHTADDTHYISSPYVEKHEMVDFDEIAKVQSRKLTTRNLDGDGRLFLFFTRTVEKKAGADFTQLIADVQLYNVENKRISRLDDNDWDMDVDQGWIAFNGKVSPGIYYLAFKGSRDQRSFLIEVFPDCQSQVFLKFNETFDFSTFNLLLSTRNEYMADYAGRDSFEMAISALQKRKFGVSNKVLMDLAYGKWERPMYGIVVAYLYLLSDRHDRNSLFEQVVNNLSNTILNAPLSSDLRIIHILFQLQTSGGKSLLEITQNEDPFDTPPMLRIGLEKLYDFSNINPELITENSITDLISDRLYKDTPWTSFKPYKSIHTFETRNVLRKKGEERGQVRKALFAYFEESESGLSLLSEWIEDFLPRLIEILDRQRLLTDFSGEKLKITMDDLAMELNLPLVSIRRKIRSLSQIIHEKPLLTETVLIVINKWFDKDFSRREIIELLNTIQTDEGMGTQLIEEPTLTQ